MGGGLPVVMHLKDQINLGFSTSGDTSSVTSRSSNNSNTNNLATNFNNLLSTLQVQDPTNALASAGFSVASGISGPTNSNVSGASNLQEYLYELTTNKIVPGYKFANPNNSSLSQAFPPPSDYGASSVLTSGVTGGSKTAPSGLPTAPGGGAGESLASLEATTAAEVAKNRHLPFLVINISMQI